MVFIWKLLVRAYLIWSWWDYTCITHDLIWGGLEHVWDGAYEILPLEELEFDQHPLHTRPAAAPEGVHILRLLHQRAGRGFLRCPIIPCKHHQPMLRTSIKLVKSWSSLIIVNSELVCSSFRRLYQPWLCLFNCEVHLLLILNTSAQNSAAYTDYKTQIMLVISQSSPSINPSSVCQNL